MRTCVNKVLMCKLRTMRTMHIPRCMRESNYYLYHTLTNCVNNVSPFSNSVLGQFQFESKSQSGVQIVGEKKDIPSRTERPGEKLLSRSRCFENSLGC